MTPEGERKRKLTEQGLCRQCPQPPKAAVPGRLLCEEHILLERAYKAKARAARLAAGLCVVPRCRRANEPGFQKCKPCLEKYQRTASKWYQKNKARRAEYMRARRAKNKKEKS